MSKFDRKNSNNESHLQFFFLFCVFHLDQKKTYLILSKNDIFMLDVNLFSKYPVFPKFPSQMSRIPITPNGASVMIRPVYFGRCSGVSRSIKGIFRRSGLFLFFCQCSRCSEVFLCSGVPCSSVPEITTCRRHPCHCLLVSHAPKKNSSAFLSIFQDRQNNPHAM